MGGGGYSRGLEREKGKEDNRKGVKGAKRQFQGIDRSEKRWKLETP